MKQLTLKNKALSNDEKRAIEDQKQEIIKEQGFLCWYCNNPLISREDSQMSHIIPKWDSMIKKYGIEVIHHKLNVPVCHKKCNSYVMIHPSQKEAIKEHLKPIYQDLIEKGFEINEKVQ